jgi:hypothetical protein
MGLFVLTDDQIEKHAQSVADAARGHVDPARSVAEYSFLLSRSNGWTMDETVQISLRALEGVFETLSAFLGFRWSAQSLEHQADHGDLNHRFTILDEFLVIFAESPTMPKPCERAFHDPASGQHLETDLVLQLADDLQHPATPPIQPFDQLPGVPSIGPHQRNRRKQRGRLEEQQLGSITILNRGRMHHDRQQQPQCIYQDMTLATVDFLAGVVPMNPPFSVVFTD